jgi:plastocyanin
MTRRPFPDRAADRTVRVIAVIALAAATALLVGCGDTDDGGGGGGGDGLLVSMVEFGYDPDPIVLPSGETKLDVVNDGQVAHDLVIGELGKGTIELAPGERQVLDLSGQPAGTYRVVCDLPGHIEAGMVSEITIP